MAHPEDDIPPPGAPFLHNNINEIPLVKNGKYGGLSKIRELFVF